jgi:integrase
MMAARPGHPKRRTDQLVVHEPGSVSRLSRRAAARDRLLRDRRPATQAAVVGECRAGRAAPLRAAGWRPAPVRATPAPARAAVELAREGVPLPVIQRQPGHTYVSTTNVYLQSINTKEIISAIHARRAPMMHASAGLEF